jgi:hypothetical protein
MLVWRMKKINSFSICIVIFSLGKLNFWIQLVFGRSKFFRYFSSADLQMVPFSSSTPDQGKYCSWRLSTPAFGLVKNGLDNWPSGKQPKKLPLSLVLFLLRSSRNWLLSPVRECWVGLWYLCKGVIVHGLSSLRPPWGPFARFSKYCHQGQWAATSFPGMYEDGEIRWSDPDMFCLI